MTQMQPKRGDQVRLTDGTLARVAGSFAHQFLILHAGNFFSVDLSEVEAIIGHPITVNPPVPNHASS